MIVLSKQLFLKTVEINILWFTHKKNIKYVDGYIKQVENSISENFNDKGEKKFNGLKELYQFVANKIVENNDLKDIVDTERLTDNIINDLGEKYKYSE